MSVQPADDPIRAAVITVSDRCAKGEAEDTSGPAVSLQLSDELNVEVETETVVPDEPDEIASSIRYFVMDRVDLVVTTGGTGFGPRDNTPEATRSVIEREAPGLSELMRAKSAEKTPFAWLSRGVCGIAGQTLIINLPGSEKGATESVSFLSDVLPHAVQLLRGNTDHG